MAIQEVNSKIKFHETTFVSLQPYSVRRHAEDTLNTAWDLINSSDWQLEKETADGARVYSKSVPKHPKLFCLTAKVNLPAATLLMQLFDKIEEMPLWNPTVIESKRLKVTTLIDVVFVVSSASKFFVLKTVFYNR